MARTYATVHLEPADRIEVRQLSSRADIYLELGMGLTPGALRVFLTADTEAPGAARLQLKELGRQITLALAELGASQADQAAQP